MPPRHVKAPRFKCSAFRSGRVCHGPQMPPPHPCASPYTISFLFKETFHLLNNPLKCLELVSPFGLAHRLCISGGQLGLWVGISCITMCELLDLAAQLIIYLCAGERRKKAPEDVDG